MSELYPAVRNTIDLFTTTLYRTSKDPTAFYSTHIVLSSGICTSVQTLSGARRELS